MFELIITITLVAIFASLGFFYGTNQAKSSAGEANISELIRRIGNSIFAVIIEHLISYWLGSVIIKITEIALAN